MTAVFALRSLYRRRRVCARFSLFLGFAHEGRASESIRLSLSPDARRLAGAAGFNAMESGFAWMGSARRRGRHGFLFFNKKAIMLLASPVRLLSKSRR